MKNIKTLSNVELVKVYQEAKVNFRNAVEGTPEELEADRIYTELFNELNDRNIDLRDYQETKQTIENKVTNSNNTIKQVKTFVKSLVIATTILLTTSILAFADTTQPIQDKKIVDYYTMQNNDVKTIYEDNSFYINSDVNIYSIDKLNNTIAFNKEGQLYSFYVDKDIIDSYYLNEAINVTMDNNNEVVDCIVDTQPVVYKNVSVVYSDDKVCCVRINDNVYDFVNEDSEDGWKVGDKCNVIIQDDMVLEVRPVPLCDR
jgi:hypothetical protein